MIAQWQAKYETALERAHANHLQIVGRGYRKADHCPVYAVQSASQPGLAHFVFQTGLQLTCTCRAGTFSVYCQHRALVRQAIQEGRYDRLDHRIASEEGRLAEAVKAVESAERSQDRRPLPSRLEVMGARPITGIFK